MNMGHIVLGQKWIILIHFCIILGHTWCVWINPWWHQQMETISSLLALCEGNPPVNGGSPHKGQWRIWVLMFSLICALTNSWANTLNVGDLRSRDHYDVTVMLCHYDSCISNHCADSTEVMVLYELYHTIKIALQLLNRLCLREVGRLPISHSPCYWWVHLLTRITHHVMAAVCDITALHGPHHIPAWISNYIHYKKWDEISYPFLNFNGATVEV